MSMRGKSERVRRTLREVLHRAHLGASLVAVASAGMAITVLGVGALRAYSDHNLQLIGRSLAYTVEAAVVFRDAIAAEDALALIVTSEEVARASVLDREGKVLASWIKPATGTFPMIERYLAELMVPTPIVLPIMHQQTQVGTLQLDGDGDSLLRFLGRGMAGMLACLIFSALIANYLSRRLVGTITGPMRELAEVAHAVRSERAFDRRVPAADIAELNDLGDDFNALLDEFEGWHANLHAENTSLSYLAAHDGLTGLWNRTFFESQLKRILSEPRTINRSIAVLFVDCDRFKKINDKLGHAAGDAVLTCVARRLLDQVRESDIVARMGGDEFAILLAPTTTSRDALRIADNIIASMHAPITLPDDDTVTTSLSIGIAARDDRNESPDSLLQRADAAMYVAKQNRGSRHLSPSATVSF